MINTMFKKRYQYDILVPKFSFDLDFDNMSLKQTSEYFNWFMNNIPTRIEYLSRKMC